MLTNGGETGLHGIARGAADPPFPLMNKLVLLIAFCCTNVGAAPSPFDTAKIDQITDLKGKWNEAEGVYRVTFPRYGLFWDLFLAWVDQPWTLFDLLCERAHSLFSCHM